MFIVIVCARAAVLSCVVVDAANVFAAGINSNANHRDATTA